MAEHPQRLGSPFIDVPSFASIPDVDLQRLAADPLARVFVRRQLERQGRKTPSAVPQDFFLRNLLEEFERRDKTERLRRLIELQPQPRSRAPRRVGVRPVRAGEELREF